VEGWTAEHDDEYIHGELVTAAVCYVLEDHTFAQALWPWDLTWWKPSPDDRIKELKKAAALIAAEIDRLIRLEDKK
jgi:hypothetical protein